MLGNYGWKVQTWSKHRIVQFSYVLVFFSISIPCTYTSSPLDGMARNNNFLSTWIRKSTHFGLDPFYPTTLYPREKPFGQRWDRTRLASSASKHAIHYAITSRAMW